MDPTDQQTIAKMLDLPSLYPFQHGIPTLHSCTSANNPQANNTTLACLPTGSGKSATPLVLLAEKFIHGIAGLVIVECPLNRAMESFIDKAKKVHVVDQPLLKILDVLIVPQDMARIHTALTVDTLTHNTIISTILSMFNTILCLFRG